MIKYIAQRMGRAHRKTVCSSSSEGGQRYTPAEECGVRRNTVWTCLNHLYGTALLGLCLPLANYLVSFFTPDWSMHLPKD